MKIGIKFNFNVVLGFKFLSLYGKKTVFKFDFNFERKTNQ